MPAKHKQTDAHDETIPFKKVERIVAPGETVSFSGKVQIRSTDILHGEYEAVMWRTFNELGFVPFYEPFKFEIEKRTQELRTSNGEVVHPFTISYPPDFVLKPAGHVKLDEGKVVAFESHGYSSKSPKERYIDKLEKFMKNHGERVYFIFVENGLPGGAPATRELTTFGPNGKCADEHWQMPIIERTAVKIGGVSKFVYDEEDKLWWADNFLRLLSEFLDMRAGKLTLPLQNNKDLTSQLRKAI